MDSRSKLGMALQFVDGNEVARHTSVVDQLQDLNVGQQLEVLEFAFIRLVQVDGVVLVVLKFFKDGIEVEVSFAFGVLQKIFDHLLGGVRRLLQGVHLGQGGEGREVQQEQKAFHGC